MDSSVVLMYNKDGVFGLLTSLEVRPNDQINLNSQRFFRFKDRRGYTNLSQFKTNIPSDAECIEHVTINVNLVVKKFKSFNDCQSGKKDVTARYKRHFPKMGNKIYYYYFEGERISSENVSKVYFRASEIESIAA